MGTKHRIGYAAGMMTAFLVLAGCSVHVGQAQADEQPLSGAIINTPTKDNGQTKEVSYSVWNAYWNLEGAEVQTEELAEHVKNVNYFAAYYDKDDTAFIPQNTTDFFAKTGEAYKERGFHRYLTVVNDQIKEDGSSDQKSTELLYRLLEKEDTYRAQADSLVTLAKDAGYDGLEIDYENIRKDNTLWGYYMKFIGYLYEKCSAEGLLLRVVIEMNIESDKIPWVTGPTYCVMCYNLYGSHSGPGPKADHEFLQTVMNKMKNVPGPVDYALANGGFDWGSDGSVTSLTTKQAQILAAEFSAECKTDASGAKYYTYTDENGMSHEVWYGDMETLEIWMKWLQEGGNWEYSIWRLGD